MTFVPVDDIEEVLDTALQPLGAPLAVRIEAPLPEPALN